MATLDSGDSNIIEGDNLNWRLIVYPAVAAVLLILGGSIYYFYLQNQRLELEDTARAALLQAKTPEALIAVANQYPDTTQATLARLSAASLSYDKKDFAAAINDYLQIVNDASANPMLVDSAQMGLASTYESNNQPDDAIKAYMAVARRGSESPYAPAAYHAVASIYQQRGDKTNEISALSAAAALDPQSAFVRDAQEQLKELNATSALPPSNNPVITAPRQTPKP